MWRIILFIVTPLNIILGLVLASRIIYEGGSEWEFFCMCLNFFVAGFCLAILLANPDQYRDYKRRGEVIKKAATLIRNRDIMIRELESKLEKKCTKQLS